MSETRLGNTRFSRKRSNYWAVDLNNSSVYRPSGDRLLDQALFHISQKADTLELSGSSITQGGNLLLGRGNDTLIIQMEQFSGEEIWTIDTEEDHDRIELKQSSPEVPFRMEGFSILLGSGNDTLIANAGTSLVGTSTRYSVVDAGLGNDRLELGQTDLEYLNIDTSLGRDTLLIFNSAASNISCGDDSDTITTISDGLIKSTSIATGAGDDNLALNGSIEQSAIDTGSGDDHIEARTAQALSRIQINTGDGNDTLMAAFLTNCSIQTGDGDDAITGYLSGNNTISLNDGNDDIMLSGYSSPDGPTMGSTINGGTGNDTLSGNFTLILTNSNAKQLPSYTEEVSESGNFVFTYYGNADTPLLTLIGFENLTFANASFSGAL